MTDATRDPRQVLQDVFGYDDFRGRQREAIDSVLAGRDVLFIMSTGGGKSLCYQIPALVLPGTTIVVTPLIALMKDQVATLRRRGVHAAALTGETEEADAAAIARDVASGHLKMLYVAPERLGHGQFQRMIAQGNISLIAIDEAHCVVQWGADFRPAYINIADFCDRCAPHVPRIALTATATASDRRSIVDTLRLRDPARIILPPERPHITHRVVPRERSGYRQVLDFIRREHENHCGVIYCGTQKKVETLGNWLHQEGLAVLPYHAGLDQRMKDRHLQRFLNEDGLIMIATIAFGMGIDKPDVRFVAHTEPAQSLDGYFQETGRAGRDRQHADAWLAYHPQDAVQMRAQLARSEDLSPQAMLAKQARLEAMLTYCTTARCRMQILRTYFGETAGEPCGKCDVCATPRTTFDATEQAKKLLSATFRAKQAVSLDHLIDILTGTPTLAVVEQGHHVLPTFGVGMELQRAEWRILARSLADQDIIRIADGGGETVYFGSEAKSVLGDPLRTVAIPLFQADEPYRDAGAGRTSAQRSEMFIMKDLLEWRKRRAGAAGVPPMVIATDQVLQRIAAARPTTEMDLANVVGSNKAAAWWDDIQNIVCGDEGRAEIEAPDQSTPGTTSSPAP